MMEEIGKQIAAMMKSQVHCGADDEPVVIAKRMVAAVSKGGFATGRCGLWSLALSNDVPKGTGWVFSAKLPNPCCTTDKEWIAVGMLSKAMGATCPMPKSIEIDPYLTHYWRWV